MTKKTFSLEVVKVIEDIEIDERHRLQLRICSWNGAPPVVELRPLHLKNGEFFNGQHIFKCKKQLLKDLIQGKTLEKALKAWEELDGQNTSEEA